jgi:hypothetical protein
MPTVPRGRPLRGWLLRKSLQTCPAVAIGRAAPEAFQRNLLQGIDIEGHWLIEEHAHCASSGRITGVSQVWHRQGRSSPPGSAYCRLHLKQMMAGVVDAMRHLQVNAHSSLNASRRKCFTHRGWRSSGRPGRVAGSAYRACWRRWRWSGEPATNQAARSSDREAMHFSHAGRGAEAGMDRSPD